MLKTKTYWFLILLAFTACATKPSTETPSPETGFESTPEPEYLPTPEASRPKPPPFRTTVIDHGDYQVFYDTKIRSARYVRYVGEARNLRYRTAIREDRFKADPILIQLRLPHVDPKEYTHSGYDRGHLAPAADFVHSQKAMNETFVMSNMSPQKPNLNRKAWKALEVKVRRWICGEGRVLVLTGPIYSDRPQKLKSGLPIPDQFFKIVVDQTPPQKTLGFIYNQTDSTDVMEKRMVKIDEIEKKTHLRFDDELPPEARPSLRTPSSFEEWKEKDCV